MNSTVIWLWLVKEQILNAFIPTRAILRDIQLHLFRLERQGADMNAVVQAAVDAIADEGTAVTAVLELVTALNEKIQAGIDANDIAALQSAVDASTQQAASIRAAIAAVTNPPTQGPVNTDPTPPQA